MNAYAGEEELRSGGRLEQLHCLFYETEITPLAKFITWNLLQYTECRGRGRGRGSIMTENKFDYGTFALI